MGINVDYMEVECFEFLINRIRGAYLVDRSVDLQAVVVNDNHKVVQLVEAGKHGCFPDLSFFDLSVSQERIYAVILIVQLSAQSHAGSCGDALSQGCLLYTSFLITNLLLKLLYRMKERMLDNEELLNHYLTRGFMEMVVFRLNRQFSREIHKAERSKDEIVRSKIGISFIHEAFFAAFAALIILIKAALIIYAWYTRSISIGAVVALITLVDNAYTPIAIFNVLFVQYRLDTAAFKRYTSFLDSPEDPQLQNGSAMASFHGNIMVKQLDFTYSGRQILRGLSLTIAPGEKIALAGSSGSGKSTLVKLLAGLLKPDRGQILVDNQELRCVKLDDYYRHIAYIPQESPVFDSTLRENLIFDSTLPDAALIRALEKVQLLKWFQGLEDGLDTQLGERGVRLSGGERQRLALARLWFSDARLIILDESTSAMDNLTEELVMKEVLALADGRNIIAIAHRLNSCLLYTS